MYSRLTTILFLSVGALLPRTIRGHFFWAETNEEADHVTVTFSENAGVPDKVISMMESRVKKMAYFNGGDTDAKMDVLLTMNENRTLLEGDFPQSYSSPAMVLGYLDFGPFMKFHDLQYSFGAQVYASEEDYDSFFRPMVHKQNENKPSIVLRNCGGSKGTSFQFDVGGFPPSQDPLGVCVYRKGGVRLGCGEFRSRETEEQYEALSSWETSTARLLRRSVNSNTNKGLSIEISPATLDEHSEESPYLLYAMANKTTTNKTSGDISISFASTSVYFEGPCKEGS